VKYSGGKIAASLSSISYHHVKSFVISSLTASHIKALFNANYAYRSRASDFTPIAETPIRSSTSMVASDTEIR